MPNPELDRWASRGLGAVMIGAWGGLASVMLEQSGPAVFLLVSCIAASYYCAWRVSRELAIEPSVSEGEARKWRDLLVFAPAVLVVLWVRLRYLRRAGEEHGGR